MGNDFQLILDLRVFEIAFCHGMHIEQLDLIAKFEAFANVIIL